MVQNTIKKRKYYTKNYRHNSNEYYCRDHKNQKKSIGWGKLISIRIIEKPWKQYREIKKFNIKNFDFKRPIIHQNCNCKINTGDVKFDKENVFILGSRDNKQDIYLIDKCEIKELLNNVDELYPCWNFNGEKKTNSFLNLMSENENDMKKIKQYADEIYSLLNADKKVKRDFHKTHILKLKKQFDKEKPLFTMDKKEHYFGFTIDYVPKTNKFYSLGIIQEKKYGYEQDYFNISGGKREVFYNKGKKTFVCEKSIECAKREFYEETGLMISDELFEECKKLAKKNSIKFMVDKCNSTVYNLILPPINKLVFEKKFGNDNEKVHYNVTLKK